MRGARPNILSYYGIPNGCGYYRMIWPHEVGLAQGKTAGLAYRRVIRDEALYADVDLVRIQNFLIPQQKADFEYLMEMRSKFGFRIIYELDDIPFISDIPEYNLARMNFKKVGVTEEMTLFYMKNSDEITTTTGAIREYLREDKKITDVPITIIPNFQPKAWMGNLFSEVRAEKNYLKTVRPRILYSGGANHFSMTNHNMKDDFSHVVEFIRGTVEKYHWIFVGHHPPSLNDLVRAKKITHAGFLPVCDMPEAIRALEPHISYAPLKDNVFNRCKSDIKLTESSLMGIPFVGQAISTYSRAKHRFTSSSQLEKEITKIMSTKDTYMTEVRSARAFGLTNSLDNRENIGCYEELARFPHGSHERVFLSAHQCK